MNDFGDYFAQDTNTDAMHRCLAVIRHELVEECDPIWHPEIIEQLDWIDRTLDRIEARRMVAIQHVVTNMTADRDLTIDPPIHAVARM